MRTKFILIQIFLVAWLIICAALFIAASATDYLHIAVFPDWTVLSKNLPRIALVNDSLQLLGALAGALLFSLACLSLGLRLLQGVIKNKPLDLAFAVTAFVLGEIVFSIVFLLLLNIGWLTPTTSAIFLFLGFISGFPAFRGWTSTLSFSALPSDYRRRERIALTLLCFIVLASLFYASARLSYDSVAEYFSHAKIMALARRPIIFYPNDSFVVSSFHPGILFTASIQLFGDQSARMISWLNGLAILLLGLAFGQNLGLSPHARLWFLILTLTSTAFVDLLGDGKIELISTAPILAAIYWMQQNAEPPVKGRFVLIGILTGFAVISRPYNIFLVPVFAILFYLNQMRIQVQGGQFRFWQFAGHLLWILLPLTLLGAFHLLENWLLLGDPLAPLTYAQNLGTTDWQWQFKPSDLIWYRAFYPLVAAFVNSPQSLGNVSPLFVVSLTFLSVGKIRSNFNPSPQLKQLTIVAAITLTGWLALFFTVVEIRYIFFLWIILFLFGAKALEIIENNADGLARLLLPSLSIGLLTFIGARVMLISAQTFSPIDKNGQAHCYDIGLCTFFESANQEAALGERVFVLNAYRYYLRPDLFACSSRMGEYASLSDIARDDPSEFWAEIYRRGFGFLVYEENFAVRHTRFGSVPDAASAPEWLNVQVVSSTPERTGVVYRLAPRNPSIIPETVCAQNSAGLWEVRSSSH